MTKKTWTIETTRRDFLRYIAWELGLPQALQYAVYFKNHGTSGLIRLNEIPCPRDINSTARRAPIKGAWKRKREATAWSERMYGASSFIEGRLGRRTFHGNFFTVVEAN